MPEIPTPWDEEIALLRHRRLQSSILDYYVAAQAAYRRGWADAMAQQAKANAQYLSDLEDAGVDA